MDIELRSVVFDGDPKSWYCVQCPDGVHVLPGSDLIEHSLTDDCVCGVATEPVPSDDGEIGWLYTHNSLDGREANEDF